jgi:hypothetical protein
VGNAADCECGFDSWIAKCCARTNWALQSLLLFFFFFFSFLSQDQRKGVWYLDPSAATPQTRPSQIKTALPHPTVEQRRFELVEWARDRGPASLNYQFVLVLLHLGVPLKTFLSLLQEHAFQLRDDMTSRPLHFLRVVSGPPAAHQLLVWEMA